MHVLIPLMLHLICICIWRDPGGKKSWEIKCNLVCCMIILCTGIIQIHITDPRELITFCFSLEPTICVVILHFRNNQVTLVCEACRGNFVMNLKGILTLVKIPFRFL